MAQRKGRPPASLASSWSSPSVRLAPAERRRLDKLLGVHVVAVGTAISALEKEVSTYLLLRRGKGAAAATRRQLDNLRRTTQALLKQISPNLRQEDAPDPEVLQEGGGRVMAARALPRPRPLERWHVAADSPADFVRLPDELRRFRSTSERESAHIGKLWLSWSEPVEVRTVIVDVFDCQPVRVIEADGRTSLYAYTPNRLDHTDAELPWCIATAELAALTLRERPGLVEKIRQRHAAKEARRSRALEREAARRQAIPVWEWTPFDNDRRPPRWHGWRLMPHHGPRFWQRTGAYTVSTRFDAGGHYAELLDAEGKTVSFVYPNPMPTKAHTVSNSKHYDWSAFYPDEVHAWKTAQAAVEHLRTFGHTREPFGVWPRERIIGLGAYDGEALLRRQLEGLGKDPE